jgi:HlyD family secretion protein
VSRIADARARAGLRPIADDGGAWERDGHATRLFLAVRAEPNEASDDAAARERAIQIEDRSPADELGSRNPLKRPRPAVSRVPPAPRSRRSAFSRALTSWILWVLFGLAVLATVIGAQVIGVAGVASAAGRLMRVPRWVSADAVDPAKVVTAKRGMMVRSVVATGRIQPVTKVEIKSKANGIIKALRVMVDSMVREGDVLAELDKEQLLAAERGAVANLQAAEAAVFEAEAQLKKNRLEAERPEVEFARRALGRAESLFSQGIIPPSALDDARSSLEVAENHKRTAESELAVSEGKVVEAKAQVAQATAVADRAHDDVANATIRAPISATVLTRDVEIGSAVSSILNLGAAGTLVMTLGDIRQVFVRGRVHEADIGRVRPGQLARIHVEAFDDKVFNGRVTQISPMGLEKDSVTNFEISVSIDNPAHELKPNMTANAEIILEEYPNALFVPEAAVTYDASKNAFVDLLAVGAKNSRKRVPVKLGVSNGTNVQVLEGIREDDMILLPS